MPAHDSKINNARRFAVSRRSAIAAGLMALAAPSGLAAASQQEERIYSPETILSFSKFRRAILDIESYLRAISFQRSAIIGLNYFAVSTGGIDAVKDLEENRGVDPETLGGLLAGMATPEVSRHLNMTKTLDPSGNLSLKIDAADGRLRYKGSVIRMYPASKLKELFERRRLLRAEQSKIRTEMITKFVNVRLAGNIERNSGASDRSEVGEISLRFEELGPLLVDAVSGIEADISTSSMIGGGDVHMFGLGSGGIDVLTDVNQSQTVDPETIAAIFAGETSPEYEQELVIGRDRVTFRDQPLKMYSIESMQAAWRNRQRLNEMARVR